MATTTFEIFVNDLTKEAKQRLAKAVREESAEDAFNEFIPLAIIEFEDSED